MKCVESTVEKCHQMRNERDKREMENITKNSNIYLYKKHIKNYYYTSKKFEMINEKKFQNV